MMFECANCDSNVSYVFYDKISRKIVCESCKDKAIEMKIRFEDDYARMVL